jgi:N6-adenosine-specific RNA methylase IME4/ParB-like chromosome segregation protein Spo0J
MSRGEYRALVFDIARRGIVVPLEVTRAGVVLDGRHRLRAANELAITSVPLRIVAPEDEVTYMLLAALSRRQLTPSQRAALAVELDHYQRQLDQAKRRRNANLRPRGSDVATLPQRNRRTRELGADLAGVGARTIQDAHTVHQADPRLFEAVKQGRLPAHTAARRIRQARRDHQLRPAPLPRGRFQLIYDPPWQLGNPSSAYAPENHYPTMTITDICALPVPAAEDAVLFLWTVSSKLPEALQVMAAWGFQYRSSLVWIKDWIGLGTWVRHRHELLLIANRGSWPPPQPEDRTDSVIEAKRGRHSEKPARAYELIERMYPDATKLELFARGKPRAGWTAWGNEVEAA